MVSAVATGSPASSGSSSSLGRSRLVLGYAVLAAFVPRRSASRSPPARTRRLRRDSGIYATTTPACFGSTFVLDKSGEFVDIDGDGDSDAVLRLDNDRLTGDASCAAERGGRGSRSLGGGQEAAPRGHDRRGAVRSRDSRAGRGRRRRGREAAAPRRPSRLMLAIAVVILAARLIGPRMAKVGQPRVMGEVLAGILLGPTLLGARLRRTSRTTSSRRTSCRCSRRRPRSGWSSTCSWSGWSSTRACCAAGSARPPSISNTSVAFPMALGFLVALPLYRAARAGRRLPPVRAVHGRRDVDHGVPGAGADPVERRMLKRPVGRAGASPARAIDDVTAWVLLALATARRGQRLGLRRAPGRSARGGVHVGRMLVVGRPLLARVSTAYDEAGRVPIVWLGASSSACCCRPTSAADRHRGDLRRLRDRADHAAPRRPDRGRHAAPRGLRRHRAAAAVLRLHRPEDQGRLARPAGSCGCSRCC